MLHTVTVRRAPKSGWVGASRTTASRVLTFVLRWVAISTVLYLFGRYLFQHGFLSLNLVFFAEKARLAIDGAPPRLVNIGFVYPPLSFILMLPFRDPVLAQAVIAGATICAVLRFLDWRVEDAGQRRLAKIYILFSPIFLYPAVEDYSLLLLAVVLALVAFYLGRYLDYEYSLYLFAAGILFGLTFFIDFRTIYLLALFLPAVFLPLVRRSLSQAISVTLAMAIPVLFMAGAWIYINWIFLGDGFAFVHGPSSFFRSFSTDATLLAISNDPVQTLGYSLRMLLITLPVTCAYFVGLFLVRSHRLMYLAPTVAVYCAPIMLLASSVYAGVFAPSTSVLIFFLLMLFYEFPRMRRSPLLTASLVLSLLASMVIPFFSPNADERNFARALATSHVQPNLDEYKEVASALGSTHGRILIDDSVFYPVVFLADSPRRFILPYEYEFDTALADPRLLATYIVTTRTPGADLISSVHPKLSRGELKGYTPYLLTAHYIVMARKV